MRYGNDNSVRLWDVGAGKELKKLEGHSGCVFCVEWAPDGSQLVRGGQDGEIKWWSPTGECLNTLKGHRYLLCCAACASSPLRGRGVEQLQVKLSNHLQS